MYRWITVGHNKPYCSAIFARGIHKGNWDEYEKGYHEYCLVLNQE